MKNYNPDKNSSYLTYLDENKSYRWAMSQKEPVNAFKQIENTFFTGKFIKTYN